MGMGMKLVLVDDHAATRAEMVSLIARNPDMEVVAQSDTGEDAIEMVRRFTPDMVIMDIVLPGITGVEATATIVRELPKTRIVALSNHGGRNLVQAFLKAGGKGYVRKDRAFEELVPAIRAVWAGEAFQGQHVMD